MRYQVLISSSELGATAMMFNALSMYLPDTSYNQYSGTFNGTRIYYCHTTRTSLSTIFADNYSGNSPVMVLSNASLALNGVELQWKQIALDKTINYNGTDNLLIEFQWDSSPVGGLITATTSLSSSKALTGASVDATSGNAINRPVFQLNYLTPVTPLIELAKYVIQSGDAFVDPGETIQISCLIQNFGLAATNVQATLSTTSSWCVVTQPNWTAGTLAKGSMVSNSAAPFSVAVNSGAPCGASIDFDLAIQANGGVYTNTCSFRVSVAEPVLALDSFLVNDFQGNTNLALNPGERIQVIVCITNSGLSASNVIAVLSSSNPYVSMVSTSSTLDAIPKLGMSNNKNNPFCIQVATNAWLNGAYPFYLDVFCNGGAYTSRLSFVASASYATAQADTSSWVSTTGGTTLGLTDESLSQTSIGFAFPFYGQTWSNVLVVANGYLIFSKQTVQYSNLSIPNSGIPNGFIAPFWDDLNPATGGVVRCASSGVAPNRMFAVEWSGVPAYPNSGACTFEVILYENGRITFQYGAMSGTASNGISATIGIENYAGSAGILHSCNQAGAVSNGLSLTFDTTAPPADSDTDGLPDYCETFYWGSLSQVPNGDSDGDGISNVREILSGNNPSDSNNVLSLSQVKVQQGTNMVLSWTSVPGQPYSVLWSTNLMTGWSNLNTTPYVGTAEGQNQCTVNVNAVQSAGFFRITTP